MEMEATGPCSKKRKSAGLDPLKAANPAAAAAEGHDPGTAAEDLQRPLPGADGGGEDRISQLPDDVLGDIISLLPTKEGARTQVLASRWRNLWSSAPLNLDHHRLCQNPKDLDAVVSRILSAHPGPGRRFRVPVYHLHGDRAATADAWLRSPALDNLQELELCTYETGLPYPPSSPLPPPPPSAAFRFSETLCVAIIGDCHLPNIAARALHFPKLKKLWFEGVIVSESSLHNMLAGCLALECLLISHSDGFRCVRINSISLRSIGCQFDAYPHPGVIPFVELVIENAPCLERLLQLGSSRLQTSLISAPKLEALGCLSSYHSSRLTFDNTVIQGSHVDSPMSELRTVKILSVLMHALSLDAVIKLMRCFPCLEKLYIESDGPGENNLWRRKHRVLLKSFDIRLKKLSWRYYRGIKSHIDFAKFFVLNARVLELMTFQVHFEDYSEEYIAEQREMLQLDRKVSTGAHFHFTPDDSHRYAWDFRLHDLDLVDPFKRKEPYEFSSFP